MINCHSYIVESFRELAAELNDTTPTADATLDYDLLADALVWSDEYPPPRMERLGDVTCIRVLLRYRTTILLGSPDESLKLYWDMALAMFPNWAGLSAERLIPSDELRNIYEHLKMTGDRNLKKSIDGIEKYCRRVNALKSHLEK